MIVAPNTDWQRAINFRRNVLHNEPVKDQAGFDESEINQPGIYVTMLLCDHVTVAEGKLYINGGGWSVTGPNPTPMGIALLIGVPWSSAGTDVHFRLQLVLTDGHAVLTNAASGGGPIAIEGNVHVDSPVGMSPGAHLDVPLAINFPALELPAGERLIWELELNDQRNRDWRLPFHTRPALQ